ncbi:TPA: hypothetical protein DF272_04410 [Candidatus Falkowbacteria bacterium]|nr:hypothetical protein [Candidatus Falkowbacteria bacterium]
MKSLIKKLIPKFLLQWYHKGLAYLGAFIYGNPSEKMIVIGVTGTNGKSTTVSLIAKALEAGGDKVGALSTVMFKVAGEEELNDKKMTMLGRFQLQKYLKRMVDAGCKYAVVETSSQGVEQYRHIAINYDYAVFTNLTPEHIEAHGGFNNYKEAKGKFFEHLNKKRTKRLRDLENKKIGKQKNNIPLCHPELVSGSAADKEVKKTIVVNADDEHADYFLSFAADKKVTFSVKRKAEFMASNIKVTVKGTSFDYNQIAINLKLIGAFNVENALPAIVIAQNEGIEIEKIKTALESVMVIPGRTEMISQGQNFFVMVDYAPEPGSMKKLYETLDQIKGSDFPYKKLIHVLGSCGGGRDKARRPILGQMAGRKADLVFVTNEDPYDEDPMSIITEVSRGAKEVGKQEGKDLFLILDRKEAIKKALESAQENDLVLITGKGSERAMAVAGGIYIKWDDREVVRELLRK